MIGQKLAHYDIREKIGAGGMGVVYRARDERLERDVALKVLPAGALADQTARARLLREARSASALNDARICTIYEVGEADGQTYIAMEYVEGQPLSALIPSGGLPTETALDYGVQLADALAHAHDRGILHRDLKSANVKITPAGDVKVLDFGLAHRLEDKTLTGITRTTDALSQEGSLAGTLTYMAPELLRGEPADARSDIWALGILLYEMATGDLPFHGRTAFELSTAILREPPAPLPPHVLAGLRAIIVRCLAKQPGQRYQRASEVLAALEALQSNTEVVPRMPAAPSAFRHWALLGGFAVAAVALALFFGLKRKGADLPFAPAPGGRLTLLVSSESQTSDPAISPDGKMIGYIALDQGRSDLFVSRVAGGERVRLTNDASRKAQPRFSPDGERIAFARLRADARAPEICVIPALGGEAVPLIEGAAEPAWSPDGGRIVFIARKPGEREALATAAADGTDVRVLLRADATNTFLAHPAWSPDGSQITVVRSPGGIARQIWVVAASGGEARRLSNDPPGVSSDHPVFAPNGLGIIHRSNRGGATNLWYLPLDGKPAVQLTTGPGPDESPSVARDGRIAFINSRERGALVVYQLDTGNTRTVFTHSSVLWAPSFSPDGREVAVSRTEPDGSWHIWTVPLAGGTPRQITFGKVPEIYPRYTPDGASVLFFSWGPPPYRIWRVSRDGGPPVPVMPQAEQSDAYEDVSPDGRWLAFSRVEGEATRVYVMPLTGGEVRRLTAEPSTVPRWSPNGQWIAFSPDRSFASGIFVTRADGTGLRRLTDTGGWPVWWSDGKHIGYQAIGPDGNTQIGVAPFEGGTPRTLSGLRFNGNNFPFDISRDGKLLVTTNTVHVSDEIWLLEPPKQKK